MEYHYICQTVFDEMKNRDCKVFSELFSLIPKHQIIIYSFKKNISFINIVD